MSLKASRTPSKIEDILRVRAGVDDDFDVPDWLRELCLKFCWNMLSLKASRTLSKMDDISVEFLLELMMIVDVSD